MSAMKIVIADWFELSFTRCPFCAKEAVVLRTEQDTDECSAVYWCEDGHVLVKREANVVPKLVYNFHAEEK